MAATKPNQWHWAANSRFPSSLILCCTTQYHIAFYAVGGHGAILLVQLAFSLRYCSNSNPKEAGGKQGLCPKEALCYVRYRLSYVRARMGHYWPVPCTASEQYAEQWKVGQSTIPLLHLLRSEPLTSDCALSWEVLQLKNGWEYGAMNS